MCRAQPSISRVWRRAAALFFALFSLSALPADFVEVTADLEMTSWTSLDEPPQLDTHKWRVRCIVGTNTWSITASDSRTPSQSWWYTGSNLVWQFHIASQPGKGSDAGQVGTRTFDFDGDPNNSPMGPFLAPHVQAAWTAFCSGPFLKRPRRQVPLPSPIWKETYLFRDFKEEPSGFPDKTVAFEDELGLPISIEVSTKSGQPLFQYRLEHGRGPNPSSTNYFGWEFPLAFQAMQYSPLPGRKGMFQTEFQARGTVTSVKRCASPSFPVDLAKTPSETSAEPRPNRSYILKAGGPSSVTVVTNPPDENNASIRLRGLNTQANRFTFIVRNNEPEEILIWNVRVQKKSEGRGTDGFGWDTISDDYPESDRGPIPSGQFARLTVQPPAASTWRTCVLYAKEQRNASGEKVYGGNYEIISETLDDSAYDRLDRGRR